MASFFVPGGEESTKRALGRRKTEREAPRGYWEEDYTQEDGADCGKAGSSGSRFQTQRIFYAKHLVVAWRSVAQKSNIVRQLDEKVEGEDWFAALRRGLPSVG
jgi:hypothetical protein